MHETLILPETPAPAFSPRIDFTAAERKPIRTLRRPAIAPRRILLPFDLSTASVRALRAVAQFAEKTGGVIHLLHVVKPAEKGSIDLRSNRADDSMAESADRLLRHWVRRVVQGRVQTFVSIRIGDPVDAIAARALATRADLIVMTSRSCSGIKKELQRCAAERVSRLAPCPVLTIPEKCGDELAYALDGFPPLHWRIILLPVDFSTAAEQALRCAASIAAENGAKLLLAHGAESENLEEPFAHGRLRTWAARVLNEAISCETVVWPGGHSLYAILSEAVRAKANLIVLPTRAQFWARRLRAGSITDGVLRQAPCPVLSINENVSIDES